MGKSAAIVGVGQTYHTSKRKDVNGQELINEAVKAALADAGRAKGQQGHNSSICHGQECDLDPNRDTLLTSDQSAFLRQARELNSP
ncbi:hypothetical protein ACFLXE_04260 [Chloroflexota bacterium]